MIPGFLISLLTFPGVILHEFAHKIFCDLFKVRVLKVSYLDFHGEGYVLHERTENFNAIFWISTGPLIINSCAAIAIAALANTFDQESWIRAACYWLAISCGAHSFPSNQDAENVLHTSKRKLGEGGTILHYLCFPFLGLIAAANFLRIVWIDFFWAVLLTGVGVSLSGHEPMSWQTFGSQGSSVRSTIDGGYRCDSHASKIAESLKPTQDQELLLAEKSKGLLARSNQIDHMSVQLRNRVVDRTSQSEVDKYNQQVDELREKISGYNVDSAQYQKELDIYNAKVKAYNNYLKLNCR